MCFRPAWEVGSVVWEFVFWAWVVGIKKCGEGNCVSGRGVSNLNFLWENFRKNPIDDRFCEKGVLNPRYFFVLLSRSDRDLSGR